MTPDEVAAKFKARIVRSYSPPKDHACAKCGARERTVLVGIDQLGYFCRRCMKGMR